MAFANLFLPPIPLETATLFAGYLSTDGRCSLISIVAAATGGMFCGSFLLYLATKRYGINLLEKPRFQKIISQSSYQKALRWFEKYGLYTVFLGKLIPGMSLSTVVCCGIVKLETKKALSVIFLSNLLFFTVLAMTGRILGKNWGQALPWLPKIAVASLALISVFTIFTIIKYLYKYKKSIKKI